jgi:hypothetical protein
MCESAPKPTQFWSNLDRKAMTNGDFIRPPARVFSMVTFGEVHPEIIVAAEYFKQILDITKNDLTSKGSNYIRMLKPPEISGPFSKNLIISPEIKELISNDMHFNYVLFNILKILNNILDEHDNLGHVEVTLESDEDNPKWKHADITVKLDDDSLVSEIWSKASKNAKDFYKSLDARKIMPSETIRKIHRSLYIIVD